MLRDLVGRRAGSLHRTSLTAPQRDPTSWRPSRANPRLVREWLDGQAAAGLIDYDPTADTYAMSPEAVMALADDTSPVFTARGMNAFGSMFKDMERIKAAYLGIEGCLGASTTRVCSRGRSGSSEPATGPICPASGYLRSTASRPSCNRGPKSPTWAAGTAPPS